MTTALFHAACLRASRHATNRQVIECRDRIGLRPQPHATGLETRVTMVEIELAVEPRLHVIAQRDDPDGLPLRRLCRRRVSPHERQCEAERHRRHPTYVPHGPRVSHDVPPVSRRFLRAPCAWMRSSPQSSFSDTVFQSVPFTSVTSATGWPSFSAGKTLTTRYPLFSFTASEAAASSVRLAFAIASLW